MREYVVKEIVNDNFNSLSPSIYLRILWTRVPKIKHKWLQIYQSLIILKYLKYLKYWNHMYNSFLLIIHNIGQDIKILNKFLEIFSKKKKRESALIQTDHEGYFSRVMWASFAFPTLTVLLLLLLPYNLSSKLIPGRPKRILESYAAPSLPLSFSLPLFGPALNN